LPGTTRDVLRQQVHLDGLPVNLIDTAGLRVAVDAVEAEGVRRALHELARADLVLYIVDATQAPQRHGLTAREGLAHDGLAGWDELEGSTELAQLPPGVPLTLVYNKIDVSGGTAHSDESSVPPRIFLSAKSGAGLDLLCAHLKLRAGYQSHEAGAFSARRRHLDALHRARVLVESATETLQTTRAFELFAEDLRMAQSALGEITGEFGSEELLGEIFRSFCIGK
jgi:tRNA modification GTPase